MTQALIIRGRYAGQTFIPEEPLPAVEGMAELIVFPSMNPVSATGSIFALIGKAAQLRTKEDIAAQLQDERAVWGEP